MNKDHLWLITVIGICVVSSLYIYTRNTSAFYNEEIINININVAVRNVNKNFLSVALDTNLIRNGHICIINHETFIKRTSLLAPSYLRIGGTAADRLIFVENNVESNERSKCLPDPEKNKSWQNVYSDENISYFPMSGKTWININRFSKETGLDLIFDLNVLLRNDDRWNSSNAEELLRFSQKHEMNAIWQLGNEPDSFQHVFGIKVPGEELGNDFKYLRHLLNMFPMYMNASIIGPDITRPRNLGESSINYLKDFLSSVGNETINAITWHQYYLNGRNAEIEDFLNPEIFEVLKKQINAINLVVRKFSLHIPIWLSETSSAYGGGAPGLSDTFVAGFLWLDKLGIAAKMGIDVVVRQTLYYGHYSLLDLHTLDPLPDWWLSVLYKNLTSHRVLDVKQYNGENGKLRIYGHCSSSYIRDRDNGTVTLFGMNLLDREILFRVANLSHPSSYISSYIVTSSNGLTSRSVQLNGKTLKLNPDGSLPVFKPIKVDLKDQLQVPPYSLGFWVIHNMEVPACR